MIKIWIFKLTYFIVKYKMKVYNTEFFLVELVEGGVVSEAARPSPPAAGVSSSRLTACGLRAGRNGVWVDFSQG